MKNRITDIETKGRKCPFCPENSEENPNLVDPVEHLIIVFNAQGHVHIHGPFGNEYAIKKMADALLTEIRKNGIDYTPQAKQDTE